MRKYLVAFLPILASAIFFGSSCNNRKEKTQLSSIFKHKSVNEANFVPADGAMTIQTTASVPGPGSTSLVRWTLADSLTETYLQDRDTCPNAPSYFLVDPEVLESYLLDAKNMDHIKYLHVFIAEDTTTGNKSTQLMMAGVNEDGNYSYLKRDGDTSSYVLGCSAPANSDQYLELKQPSSYPADRITKIFPEKMEINDANQIISEYTRNRIQGKKNKTASSFLVDADHLYDYIHNNNAANLNVKYVQFYFAEDHDRLTLVIALLNSGGEHIYFFNRRLKYCVLEHVMPCPICDLDRAGTRLRAPRD